MMERVQTSETLVNLYQATQCYNLEDSNLACFGLSFNSDKFLNKFASLTYIS
jgi:hypothetical protein